MQLRLAAATLWAAGLSVSALSIAQAAVGAPAAAAATPAAPALPDTIGTAPSPPSEPPKRNVILILVDGIRQNELLGRALDDAGKPVRASELFPNLTALRKSGTFFSRMRISNPAGVSLPGYADIFAGRRQERILTNSPPAADFRSHYPTLMQVVRKELGLGFDGVALFASWAPVCNVAVLPPVAASDDFYRSCGFRNNAALPLPSPNRPGATTPSDRDSDPPSPSPTAAPPTVNSGPAATLPSGGLVATPIYFKPELYAGSRTDSDTFLEVLQEVPRRHPRLLVVHLVDADEEAHLQQRVQRRAGLSYGVFHYHQALRASDYYIGRIWAMLQADPFYRDNTYLVVSTDHGRDDFPEPTQWALHGHCVSEFGARRCCSGCSSIFALAVGPGLLAKSVKRGYDQTSLAPTIARLLGVAMPTATGKPMEELFAAP